MEIILQTNVSDQEKYTLFLYLQYAATPKICK